MAAPVFLALAGPAVAQIERPSIEPLVYGENCQASDPTGNRRLDAVIDAGKGRVVQRATLREGKQTDYGFLLLDCHAGKGIGVHEKTGALRGSAKDPYRINSAATLDNIAAVAAQHGDAVEYFEVGKDQPDAVVDMFCGCRNFYPRSNAARMTARP